MEMPFGKHKGIEVHQLPRRYLGWLQKNCQLKTDLAAAVKAGLKGKPYNTPQKCDDENIEDMIAGWEI